MVELTNAALRLWYGQMIHEALVTQHAAPQSAEEMAERAAWRRIQAAQLAIRSPYHPQTD